MIRIYHLNNISWQSKDNNLNLIMRKQAKISKSKELHSKIFCTLQNVNIRKDREKMRNYIKKTKDEKLYKENPKDMICKYNT